MSLRYEQYNALKITKEFLFELIDVHSRPKTISEMQSKAIHCLRHFPQLEESGKPIFSQDEFTKD